MKHVVLHLGSEIVTVHLYRLKIDYCISFQVKTFLDLQQKAAEVMAAVAIWESDLTDVEMGLGKINKASHVKEKANPHYK